MRPGRMDGPEGVAFVDGRPEVKMCTTSVCGAQDGRVYTRQALRHTGKTPSPVHRNEDEQALRAASNKL